MDLTRNSSSTPSGGVMPPKKRSMKWLIATLVIAVIVVAGAIFAKAYMQKPKTTSEYQAVFLNNGQVYFGKLGMDGKWLKLTDIYYLQLTQDLQPASTASDANTQPDSTGNGTANQQQIQLVKLGSELHGPEDEMFIAKDKVLFWENMKSDSKVMQSIRQYQNR